MRLNYRSKLMLSFFVTSIIPLIIVVFLTYLKTSNILEDQARNSTSLTLGQMAINLSNRFNQLKDVAQMITYNNISADKTTNNIFNYEDQKSVYEQLNDYRALKLFLSNMESNLKLHQIRLYINNHSIQQNQDMNFYSYDKLKEVPGFDLRKSLLQGLHWNATYSQKFYDGSVHTIVSAYKALTKIDDVNTPSVVFFIDIPIEEIANSAIDFGKNGELVILDDQGKLVYKKDSNRVGHEWNVPYLNKVLQTENGDIKIDGQILVVKTISINGWKIVARIPLETLLQQSRTVRNFTMVFVIIVLFAVLLIALFLSMSLTKRLITLLRAMESSKHKTEGEIVPKINTVHSKAGTDEIDRLILTYNQMSGHIQKLVNEVYLVKVQESTARFKALQSQINPHFLFNVLNSIRGNLLEKGDAENAEILNLLAKSFWNMLNQTGHLVHLTDEVQMVETYLRIQQFRFPKKLSFTIDIPDHLLNIKIPKLSLQPLVENAVIHGIETQLESSTVVIRAQIHETFVELSVQDDGRGIEPQKMAEIERSFEEDGFVQKGEHIGLINVHQRIKHIFGDSFGLTLESQYGIGTKVFIRLPLKYEGSDNHE